jgi:DNA gyrase/topoisomerase IV subunit B
VAIKTTEEFKILSPRDHVRSRMGLYLGSSSKEQVERFVRGEWLNVTYVPALNKIVDEILDNAIDEAIRTNFKFANKIDVSVDNNTVTVTDNGRGIPQEDVITPENEKISRPVAAWTRVNAGTSFTEDRVSIGANGVGSSCTNFVSSSFIGRTWQNGNLIEVKCSDGCNKVEVSKKSKSGSGTEVAFTPDFTLFEVDSLSELDTVNLIEDRLMSLQLAFPEIRFSFNSNKIAVTDMKKYASLFTSNDASVVIEKADNLSFFFAASEDGFRTNSFVNGVNTRQGGVYVDYIVNGIIDELTIMIKRKHKIEVAKSTLKGGLTFIMFARNFTNPKFDSQTKERLTNPQGEVRSHYEKSGVKDFKYLARKLFAANDIIEPIIAAQIAKREQQERREALQGQKKLKKIKVAKHIAASTPNASLSLCEGDSATGFFLSVRDPKMHGIYPLRGVIMNTWDLKPADVLKNKELSEVIAILGLNINEPNNLSNMTYKDIWTLADADVDGNKISTLLIAFFYKFWPNLFKQGRVSMLKTPIMIASKKGQDDRWFYTYDEAEAFKTENGKSWSIRYIKGLGLLTEEEYSKILREPVLYNISIDDSELFEMMFGDDSAPRKKYMMS